MIGILSVFMGVLSLGCSQYAHVKYAINDNVHDYRLPYQQGLVHKEDEHLRILLQFHRSEQMFKYDSGERIYVYLVGDAKAFYSGQKNDHIKGFLIRVQRAGMAGPLSIKNIQIRKDVGESISGTVLSGDISPEQDVNRNFELTFSHLPLRFVEDIDGLMMQVPEYDKAILKERFL